jgi:glycosyltransferase involved in cell wall biosynthesis
MRLWLFNHYALPPSDSGITRHFDFASRLVERGHDVTIFASSFDHYSRVDERVPHGQRSAIQMVDGVRFAWLKTRPYGFTTAGRSRNMLSFAWAVERRALALGLERPDAVLGSSPHLLTPLAASRVAHRLGVPFVLEVRDVWPDSLVELGGPSAGHPAVRALRRLEHHLYRTADRIVTPLPAAAEYFAANGGRADQVRWIPNGADTEGTPSPLPPRTGPLEIVYAGSFGQANALSHVIRAARILEDDKGGSPVRWRFVGQGPDRAPLEDLVRTLGVRSVSIDQPVAKRDVPEVLARAHACLLHLQDSPIFRWGVSPNKLFDYFAAARPVLFAVRTPVDPVAEAGAGISVAPEDPEALAEGARQLAKLDDDALDAMGRAGYEFMRREHDLDALAAKLEAVFAEVVPAPTGAR